MRYVSGIDERGNAIEVKDPLQRLREITDAAQNSPARMVDGYLGVREIFGSDLPQNETFRKELVGGTCNRYMNMALCRLFKGRPADAEPRVCLTIRGPASEQGFSRRVTGKFLSTTNGNCNDSAVLCNPPDRLILEETRAMDRFTGSCLCGDVRLWRQGTPYRAASCHCLDCASIMGRCFTPPRCSRRMR